MRPIRFCVYWFARVERCCLLAAAWNVDCCLFYDNIQVGELSTGVCYAMTHANVEHRLPSPSIPKTDTRSTNQTALFCAFLWPIPRSRHSPPNRSPRPVSNLSKATQARPATARRVGVEEVHSHPFCSTIRYRYTTVAQPEKKLSKTAQIVSTECQGAVPKGSDCLLIRNKKDARSNWG